MYWQTTDYSLKSNVITYFTTWFHKQWITKYSSYKKRCSVLWNDLIMEQILQFQILHLLSLIITNYFTVENVLFPPQRTTIFFDLEERNSKKSFYFQLPVAILAFSFAAAVLVLVRHRVSMTQHGRLRHQSATSLFLVAFLNFRQFLGKIFQKSNGIVHW